MLISKRSIVAAVVALIASSTLCQRANAQLPWEYWQVQTDPVDCSEQQIEKRILEGYLGGALDPLELAELRSELDWVKDKEEVARLSGGLSCGEQAKLLSNLDLIRFDV